LDEGALSGRTIVCPWHNAAFDITSGHLERPPAMNDLSAYEIGVEEGDIFVTLPEKPEESRCPSMVKKNVRADRRNFIILGAGAAGAVAVETLRHVGFQGSITMVTPEFHLPYDRTTLSKGYLAGNQGKNDLPLRSEGFYREHGVDLLLGRKAVGLKAQEKTIELDDGKTLSFDACLIATGGVARTLGIPGDDLENVTTLRSFSDAERIIDATQGARRAVVIGESFIGMETAASLRARGLEVTIVGRLRVPFQRTLGEDIGRMLQGEHQKNGVTFELNTSPARFEGDERVASVILENGKRLLADLVVVGVGVTPVTDFIQGITLGRDGSVPVDDHLLAAEGIYAAGDIARFPYRKTGDQIRIEHWVLAEQQGRVAAINMAGKDARYDLVPFFWTVQYEVYLMVTGFAGKWDEIITMGDVDAKDFLAFYVKDGRVTAAAGVGHDRDIAAISELFRHDRMPEPDSLRSNPPDFPTLLSSLSNSSENLSP
jgi:NADPH-dependent 2,4-dienoyl-CoA reductase/sulfur reductase-like enzyme